MLLSKKKIKILFLSFLSILLSACLTKKEQQQQIVEAKLAYINHDYSRSVNKLLKLADADNVQAQYALGYMYYYGLGISKDQDIARDWIKKAAKQKYPPAVIALNAMTKPYFRPDAPQVNTLAYNHARN